MNKRIVHGMMGCIMTVVVIGNNNLEDAARKKLNVKKDPKNFMLDLYKDINGFSVANNEYDFIKEKGGNPTYGEITYDALETLLTELRVNKHDIFYDLGCGVGKVCVQVALTCPAKKIIGVELSQTRINHAKSVAQRLIENHLTTQEHLVFLEQNIADIPLIDATIVFMCSTCFSDELMQKIMNNLLLNNKKNLRVITLKPLPTNAFLVKTKELSLRMTWSDNVQVHIYSLNGNKTCKTKMIKNTQSKTQVRARSCV